MHRRHASDRRWHHPVALELAIDQTCGRRDGTSDARRRTAYASLQPTTALGRLMRLAPAVSTLYEQHGKVLLASAEAREVASIPEL